MKYIKRIFVYGLIMLLLFLTAGCKKNVSSNSSKEKSSNKSSLKGSTEKHNNAEEGSENTNNSAVESGLLLGLRNDDNNSYRTLWISPEGNEIKLKEQNNFILVPYEDNFWRLEFKNIEYTSSSTANRGEGQSVKLSRLSSHYATEDFIWDGFNDDAFKSYVEYSDISKLLFVGNKYVCLERKIDQNTGKAVKPNNYNIGVYKINNLQKSSKMDDISENTYKSLYDSKISITSILGENVHDNIDKYAKEAVTGEDKKIIGDGNSQYKNITSDVTWGIVRSDFKWVPQIAKTWSCNNSSFVSEKYALRDAAGFYLPNSVLTYDTVPLNINDIKNAVLDARDAVSSPSHDMLVVITSNKILVFSHPEGGIKKPALTIDLKGNENIVMDQWAVGSFVSKWDAAAAKYLK